MSLGMIFFAVVFGFIIGLVIAVLFLFVRSGIHDSKEDNQQGGSDYDTRL